MKRISLAHLGFLHLQMVLHGPETSANLFPRKICHKTNYVWQAPPTRLCSSLPFASRNSFVVHNRPFNFGKLFVCPHYEIFRHDHKRFTKNCKNPCLSNDCIIIFRKIQDPFRSPSKEGSVFTKRNDRRI